MSRIFQTAGATAVTLVSLTIIAGNPSTETPMG
jgi:hypothetical protein